ncbi:MAG TPA: hypothetical protein VM324_15245 [Egibacteraceae bacterium]|nr:hypothetical protein [Egibacteraceae bacterium]
MMAANLLRKAAAGVLSLTSRAMAAGSRLADQVATGLRDERRPSSERSTPTATAREVLEEVGQAPVTEAVERSRVSSPPSEPVPEGPSHLRAPETHTEALASRSAADVLAAIPDLSTDELGRLYEYEAANKKRKTVLAAIERAVDPNDAPPGETETMSEAGGVPTTGGPAAR